MVHPQVLVFTVVIGFLKVWLQVFSPLVPSVVFTSSPLVPSVVFTSSPLVPSVVLHLLHSFRVYFSGGDDVGKVLIWDIRQRYIFSTRLKCSFTSSPLVWSVVLHLPHSFRV